MPDVLFISDKLTDEFRSFGAHHPGGAELTDCAAIEACPWPVTVKRFRDLKIEDIERSEVQIVSNSATASSEQLATLAQGRRHILFEHDVRICRWRGNFSSWLSGPAHRLTQRCVCRQERYQQLFATALGAIYLTSRQKAVFEANPVFQGTPHSRILGCSLMSRNFLQRVSDIANDQPVKVGTVIYASPHRIKGYRHALRFCRENGMRPSVIHNLTPEAVLDRFAGAERFVYVPLGLEPAGRMVLEARFLGCEIVANDNVGVCGEPWWSWPDEQKALEFVATAPQRFWRFVEEFCSTSDGASSPPSNGARPGLLVAGQATTHALYRRENFVQKRQRRVATIVFSPRGSRL